MSNQTEQKTIQFSPTPKQDLVFDLFNDDITTEIVYGGSAASGKSYLIASLIIMKCLQYPGIRVGLSRNNLTTLKKTTMTSFFEVLTDWNITSDYYSYNTQSGIIKFTNGSEVILCELQYLPSDPQYTRLGGLLLTFGVVDEAGETDEKGKEIFQSRLGRWKNDEYNIKPLLLMTCNPTKNFLYRDYYQPYTEDKLKPYQKFIQALPTDNPYITVEYYENLKRTLSPTELKRLLLGQWEYTDDETSLFKYEDIINCFNGVSPSTDSTLRMSCDIAFTSDNCILIVWKGLTIIDIIELDNKNNEVVVDRIKDTAKQYDIKYENISYDADGVGKYIRNYLPSAKEIINNGKAIVNQGYDNLKTELYFKLADVISKGELKINLPKYKTMVEEELSSIRHKPKETLTSKVRLITKIEMKRLLGRSPDIADAIAYGMIFHLKPNTMKASDFVFIKI